MFFRWNNQWYKVSYIFCFFPQVERKNLLQKWLPYSDRFGVKKTFLVTLYNSSSKIYLYALLSTNHEGAFQKKTCQASGKNAQNPGYVVLSILSHFPSFSLLQSLDFERKREQTSGVVTSTNSGLFTLTLYLNTARVWVGPKTKFMVSWLLGKFVPESKPFLFFLHGMHTCMFALKNFIHILRFVEFDGTAVWTKEIVTHCLKITQILAKSNPLNFLSACFTF